MAIVIAIVWWSRHRAKERVSETRRERVCAALGLSPIPSTSGYESIGGIRGSSRWCVHWERRKIGGGPSVFATVLECYPERGPGVEIRTRAQHAQLVSNLPSFETGMLDFDADFLCAGALKVSPLLAEEIRAVARMADDFHLRPDMLVVVCRDDQNDPQYLLERAQAMERLLQAIVYSGNRLR